MAPKKLGILGGMGPLASLAFLNTIYECNRPGSIEQESPDIILHSLSSIPDRTRSLLSSDEDALAALLIRNLRTLNACGVAKIVICCFTSHALIHRLPPDIKAKVVSLIELAAQELITRRQPSLLLASLGSYQKNVFSSTDDALKAMEYIVLPDEKDKTVTSFIAGCTEFHLLSRYIEVNGIPGISFIDPLISIARRMDQILSLPIQMDLHPVGAEAQILNN